MTKQPAANREGRAAALYQEFAAYAAGATPLEYGALRALHPDLAGLLDGMHRAWQLGHAQGRVDAQGRVGTDRLPAASPPVAPATAAVAPPPRDAVDDLLDWARRHRAISVGVLAAAALLFLVVGNLIAAMQRWQDEVLARADTVRTEMIATNREAQAGFVEFQRAARLKQIADDAARAADERQAAADERQAAADERQAAAERAVALAHELSLAARQRETEAEERVDAALRDAGVAHAVTGALRGELARVREQADEQRGIALAARVSRDEATDRADRADRLLVEANARTARQHAEVADARARAESLGALLGAAEVRADAAARGAQSAAAELAVARRENAELRTVVAQRSEQLVSATRDAAIRAHALEYRLAAADDDAARATAAAADVRAQSVAQQRALLDAQTALGDAHDRLAELGQRLARTVVAEHSVQASAADLAVQLKHVRARIDALTAEAEQLRQRALLGERAARSAEAAVEAANRSLGALQDEVVAGQQALAAERMRAAAAERTGAELTAHVALAEARADRAQAAAQAADQRAVALDAALRDAMGELRSRLRAASDRIDRSLLEREPLARPVERIVQRSATGGSSAGGPVSPGRPLPRISWF